jgi:hypothetical protein
VYCVHCHRPAAESRLRAPAAQRVRASQTPEARAVLDNLCRQLLRAIRRFPELQTAAVAAAAGTWDLLRFCPAARADDTIANNCFSSLFFADGVVLNAIYPTKLISHERDGCLYQNEQKKTVAPHPPTPTPPGAATTSTFAPTLRTLFFFFAICASNGCCSGYIRIYLHRNVRANLPTARWSEGYQAGVNGIASAHICTTKCIY